MNSELLPYYERELIFIRKIASEFAAQYPERASALKLTRDGCDDPHVERIIEAFALVAGRIQHKLDEEFPEITTSLLELLYPHLIRPVPPMAVVQFEVDPALSKQRKGQLIPRATTLYSAPVNGVQCRFRTTYPARLWPLEVSAAAFASSADVAGGINGETARYALRIELKILGGSKLTDLDITDLRFRIGGDPQVAHWIYEVLFNKVKRILLRPLSSDGRPDRTGNVQSIGLPSDSIRQVGFAREEALLPVSETSFQGYRLMQEYFCYPQKFLFFDIAGLEQLFGERSRNPLTDRFEIVILIENLEQIDRALLLESAVSADTFQLGCTPSINLFEHTAEPIRLSHTKTEYQVIPDVYAPLGMEIYSVDRVLSVVPNTTEPKEFRPFYSFQHGSHGSMSEVPEAFWFSSRRPSTRNADAGSDVFLSLVDQDFKLSQPALEAVTVSVTCTNRNLSTRLNIAGAWGDLDLESGAMVRTRVVHGPTETIRPASHGGWQWRLISHLSLNHLSLVDGGVNALREMLRLYDPTSSHATSQQIDGLIAIRSNRKIARLNSEYGFVFCQGLAIEAEMDEEKFSGGGAFLLANILERFFGLYCAVNSFTQLRVSTRQRKGVVWQWPIRSGEQAVA
jgi:type VI secretion system protein ImpG